jgi:uncharacterized protein (TIGR02270 family)
MHYFDRLALAWRRRNTQIGSYHHDFSDLIDWDERIHTDLKALVQLKDDSCKQGLDRLCDTLLEEELFILALLALKTHNTQLTQACIRLVQDTPNLVEPFSDALIWATRKSCQEHLKLWSNRDECYYRIFLAVLAHHNIPLSPQKITNWVKRLTVKPQICVDTLRCGILRGEAEWALKAKDWLEFDHPELRLTAAEALIVLGPTQSRRHMLPILRDLALDSSHPAVSKNAARKLLTVPCKEGQELLEALKVDANRQRLYLESLGWMGEPGAIFQLSERLDNPQEARLAAAVIRSLTGSHPIHDGWQAVEPKQASSPEETSQADDAIPLPDPDVGLPWPDRDRFLNWWKSQSENWPNQQRYLGGYPRELAKLHLILQQGCLAWRSQAAWHLQIVRRGQRFPWRAPVPHQQHFLSTCAKNSAG